MNFQKVENDLAKYYRDVMKKLLSHKQYARADQMVAHMTQLKKELTWIERYGDEIDEKIEATEIKQDLSHMVKT